MIDPEASGFEEICQSFTWQIPASFNIAAAVCDRHRAVSHRPALFCETASGVTTQYSFADLYRLSNQLANVFLSKGISSGDRIAILLPQRVETGLCHLAAWKIGAVSLPLSVLFGTDALRYRLEDSGAKIVVGATEGLEKIHSVRDELPELETIVNCDDVKNGFWPLLDRAANNIETTGTLADDPAIVIYTSGTTGPPKGAVLAHRCLLGNLTGFEMSQNFFPCENDLMWTPADW
ncbi:MAG TPA: AMP-dependent synthetase, partial [Gammaproteobacteria bacterium]|nr:AMP-dependent synthetase [Gammaproteobacteria bacterium]